MRLPYAVLLVLVYPMISQVWAQDVSSSTQSIRCPENVAQSVTEIEGQTLECGIVSIPANYDEPNGIQIDLMYGILRSTSLSPASDPIIYLHGGPGGGELGSLTNALAKRLSTLRERRDIIVFDQRGAAFSPGEIECNDVFAANRDDAFEAAPQIAAESGMSVVTAASEYLIPLCAEHLNILDVDLSQYNTINNARDVASLAQALGLTTYNIYGHSYGTRLGLEVIRQNPPGLRAVLLDSVLPTEVAWRERLPETNEEAFLGIYSMCLEDPACAEAYPDLVGTLNSVFDQLTDQPILLDDGTQITGGDLERLILNAANQAGAQWRVRYLPRMIHDLAQGDTEVYTGLFFQTYSVTELAPPPDFRIPDLTFDAILLLNRANGLSRQADDLDEAALALANQALAVNESEDTSPAAVFLRTLEQLETTPFSTTLDDGMPLIGLGYRCTRLTKKFWLSLSLNILWVSTWKFFCL